MIDFGTWQFEVYAHFMGFPLGTSDDEITTAQAQLENLRLQMPDLFTKYGPHKMELHSDCLEWLIGMYAHLLSLEVASRSRSFGRPIAFEQLEAEAKMIMLMAGEDHVVSHAMMRQRTNADLRPEGDKEQSLFELHHDKKTLESATIKEIAESWFDSRSPAERHELTKDAGSRAKAVGRLKSRVNYLRANRKKDALNGKVENLCRKRHKSQS